MVQPLALVRQVDGRQVGDVGAVEAAGVLARTAGPPGGRRGPRHPQDGVATQLADEFQTPLLQPLDHGRTAVVAVPHEDPDVGAMVHGQGLVQQLQHDRHLGPRRPGRAARPSAGAGALGGLQARMDGIRTVLLQVQDRQQLQLLAPGHPPLAAVPAPADPRQLAPALGQAGAVPGPGQVEGREVAGAGRLPTVRVGTASAEAGQVAVGGPDRQADQQGEQGIEVVPLRFAEGQGGQYSGAQEHGTPLGMAWRRTHTITGAVLPCLCRRPPFGQPPPASPNRVINSCPGQQILYLKNCSHHCWMRHAGNPVATEPGLRRATPG